MRSEAQIAWWAQGSAIRYVDWLDVQSPQLDYYSSLDLLDAGLIAVVMLPHKLTGKPQRYIELDQALVDRIGLVNAARQSGWVRPTQP